MLLYSGMFTSTLLYVTYFQGYGIKKRTTIYKNILSLQHLQNLWMMVHAKAVEKTTALTWNKQYASIKFQQYTGGSEIITWEVLIYNYQII